MSVHTRPSGWVPAHECSPPAIPGPPPPPGRWSCPTCGTRYTWRTEVVQQPGPPRLDTGWHVVRRGGRVLRIENVAAAYVHEKHAASAPWWAWRYRLRQRRQARFLRRLEGQR